MAQVEWSVSAADDLREIEDFIARDSRVYAVRTVDRIVAATEVLAGQPLLGRMVPEFELDKLRELIHPPYRIVYLVRGESIFILRVVHGARDFRRVVGDEPWLIR